MSSLAEVGGLPKKTQMCRWAKRWGHLTKDQGIEMGAIERVEGVLILQSPPPSSERLGLLWVSTGIN